MLSNDISESKKNNEFVFQRDLKEILESIEIKKGKGMEGGGGGVFMKEDKFPFQANVPPWKHQKTRSSLMFSWGIKRKSLPEMSKRKTLWKHTRKSYKSSD